MTPTGIAGDLLLVAAVVTIGLLEVRRHRRRTRRRERERGQAVAEFAILTAIFLPLMLVATQVALLLAYLMVQTQSTGTLADAAVREEPGPAFQAVLARESNRIGCEDPEAVITTPLPNLLVVELHCVWRAPLDRDASWPVTTSASAMLEPEPTPTPEPTETPTPEPSPSEEVPS